ncbi:MAG: energy-coupling factor transporter transmembrane component T [Candidatus Hodarchaeales archaeon]
MTILFLSITLDFFVFFLLSLQSFLIIFFYFKPRYMQVFLKMIASIPLILSLLLLSIVSRPAEFIFSNGIFTTTFTSTSFALLQLLRTLIIIFFTLSFIEGENSFFDVIYALDDFHLPGILISILFLMKRFIKTTQEELRRILDARYNRHYSTPNRFSLEHLKILSLIISGLIARSLKKSDIVSDSLSTRGFKRRFPHQQLNWTRTGLTILITTITFSSLITLFHINGVF